MYGRAHIYIDCLHRTGVVSVSERGEQGTIILCFLKSNPIKLDYTSPQGTHTHVLLGRVASEQNKDEHKKKRRRKKEEEKKQRQRPTLSRSYRQLLLYEGHQAVTPMCAPYDTEHADGPSNSF